MTSTSPVPEDGPCQECEYNYVRDCPSDVRFHKKVHDRVIHGLKTKLADGCHIVTHASPLRLQKLAEWAASAALHETNFDFKQFSAVRKNVDEYKTVAVITVTNGRVIALVVSRERACERKAALVDFVQDSSRSWRPKKVGRIQSHTRRAIDVIWVLKEHRRQGEAAKVIQSLVEACKIRREHLAHSMPLKEEALLFWKKQNLETAYLV